MSEEFDDLLQELDAKIQALESLPYPRVRDEIFEVLQLIDRAHRPGLAALAEALKAAGAWEQVLEHEPARLLLSLYDLAPLDPIVQAELALEPLRPYIRSHGGEVEVIEVDGGTVHVRLGGACGGCAASPSTLRHGVEAALKEGLHDFAGVVVHEAKDAHGETEARLAPSPATIGETANGGTLSGPLFRDLLAIDELDDRAPRLVHIDGPHAREVLLMRIAGEVFAFDPACAACGMSLDGASVSGTVLVCPFNNCAFDVRTGRPVDGPSGGGLRVIPVTTHRGRVLVATDVRPTAMFGAGPR